MGVRELFERMTNAWNAHDGDGFVATYAEDCEVTSPDLDGKGQKIVREFWEQYDRSFPDNQIVVRRTVVEGDTLVEESLFRGTNTGPLTNPDGAEVPPTGVAVEVPYLAIYTAREDQFVSCRMYWDQMAVMGQLGLLPAE
jgi:uncharacterized protein (TIGR02246 family)